MSWLPFLISLAVGLAVGVAYGLVNVRSPAPPVIALLGLLGMLIGESAVAYLRGHPELWSAIAHRKSFEVVAPAKDPSPAAAEKNPAEA